MGKTHILQYVYTANRLANHNLEVFSVENAYT